MRKADAERRLPLTSECEPSAEQEVALEVIPVAEGVILSVLGNDKLTCKIATDGKMCNPRDSHKVHDSISA
jgi:hypothetical protein